MCCVFVQIPFRVSLNLECLDTVFGIGRNTKAAVRAGKLLMVEAVYPMLSVVRALLHLVRSTCTCMGWYSMGYMYGAVQ